ncbi:MAG: hypothetical protein QOC92_527 [Acidimicrobiaceae bacterium]
MTPSVRGPAKGRHLAAEPDLQPVATWLDDPDGPNLVQRIRSGVLLVTLLTALGALTALALIVGGAVLLTGLRSAVQ